MVERTLLVVEAPGRETSRASRLTRRAGFKVQQTNSGRMAAVAAGRVQPDVVLISPQPSRARLSEIVRAIKENPATRDIPVVVLTEDLHTAEFSSRVYPTEACLSVSESEQTLLRTLRLLAPRRRKSQRRPSLEVGAPLEGSLEEDTFPELLQYLFATQKSGCVSVTCGAERGRLYLEDGSVVDASLDAHRGVEAFKRTCFMARGRFRFDPGVRPTRITMRARGLDLLLDAAREKDELERATAASGSSRPRASCGSAAEGFAEPSSPRPALGRRAPDPARPRRPSSWAMGAAAVVAICGLFSLARRDGSASASHVEAVELEEPLADVAPVPGASDTRAATPSAGASERPRGSEPREARPGVRAGM